MAQQTKPLEQIQFGGVHTAGHPLQRPAGTAVSCQNFRIMPGNWLRLRSGREARMYQGSGSFLQLVDSPAGGSGHAYVQQVVSSTPTWHELSVDAFSVYGYPYAIQIATAYDSAYAVSNRAAATSVRTIRVVYNGLGIRDATNSRPPFSIGNRLNALRYFGLDAYCPSANPSAAFAEDAGGYNNVTTSVDVWVGLYNSGSGHYSNGVYAGQITTQANVGIITVSDLQNLKLAYHNTSERGELYFVFYATVDGGQIPYLILNTDLNGPYTANYDATSASLSLVSGTTNGWVLNLDSEMPVSNYPPKPMKQIVWVNGRVYGIPLDGGSGGAIGQRTVGGSTSPDFKYQWETKLLSGVAYSSSGSDYTDNAVLGNPEESWPTENVTLTPTSEVPVVIGPGPEPESTRLLVLTARRSFMVEEIADKLHEWRRVSDIHGCTVAATLVETPHGSVWVTQRNELVLLPSDGGPLEVLSRNYQSLFSGKTARLCHYVLDPLNETDQVRVCFTDGTGVIHDFLTGFGSSATAQDYYSSATLTDIYGRKWHYAGKKHLYTFEGQGDTGLIPTADEDFGDTTTEVDTTAITGTWESQWIDYGDSNVQKELPWLDVIGDEDTEVTWYTDLEEVADSNAKSTIKTQTPGKKVAERSWRHKLTGGVRAYWYKLKFSLAGSSTQSTFAHPSTEGRLSSNFDNSIVTVQATVSDRGQNRP